MIRAWLAFRSLMFKVDRELDYANIYVSCWMAQKSSRDVIAGLNHARGYLKHEIAQEVDLRVMPRLRFLGSTPEKADRMSTLLLRNYGIGKNGRY